MIAVISIRQWLNDVINFDKRIYLYVLLHQTLHAMNGGTVDSIIHSLGCHKGVAQWIPWLLLLVSKKIWIRPYHYSIWCLRNKIMPPLHQIIAGDESCCFHNEPESKRQSVLTFDRKNYGDRIFITTVFKLLLEYKNLVSISTLSDRQTPYKTYMKMLDSIEPRWFKI